MQPAAVCWCYPRGALAPLLAVSERYSGTIHIYNAERLAEGPVGKVTSHVTSVLTMAYNPAVNCVVSCDAKGIIDIWSCDATVGLGAPAPCPSVVSFTLKSGTDLYDVAKARAMPLGLAVSPDGRSFALTSTDRKVRLFRFATGKLVRAYSEELSVYEAAHAEG